MKKVLILSLLLTFCLISLNTLKALETDENTLILDEITAETLGINEPTILPTNKVGYFLKNLGQAVRTAVTFNREKKAELQLKYANQKLLEIKKMAENATDDPELQTLIEKQHKKYNQLMDRVNNQITIIKEKSEVENVSELLDKVADNQFKQQQLLDNLHKKLSTVVSEEKLNKLKSYREQALEHFGDLIENVDPTNIRERLEKVTHNQINNQSQNIQYLKTMEELGDTLGNKDFKENFLEAKETLRERFIENLSSNPTPEEIAEFEKKLENLISNEGYKIRVINYVDEKITEARNNNWDLNQYHENLDKLKDNNIAILKKKLEEATTELDKENILKSLESAELHSVQSLEQVKESLDNNSTLQAIDAAKMRQMEQFNERVQNITDPEKIEAIKANINSNTGLRIEMNKTEDNIMNKLDTLIKEKKRKQDRINKSLEEVK